MAAILRLVAAFLRLVAAILRLVAPILSLVATFAKLLSGGNYTRENYSRENYSGVMTRELSSGEKLLEKIIIRRKLLERKFNYERLITKIKASYAKTSHYSDFYKYGTFK